MGTKSNFVSYANAETLFTAIGQKFDTLEGAYVLRGSSTFANLPTTLTASMVGYVYNMSENFTTDSRFIEGAGKKYSAGTNVAIADVSTTTYNPIIPIGTENPQNEGWFEYDSVLNVYVTTIDTIVDPNKTYYEEVYTALYKFDVIGNFVDVDALKKSIQDVSDMITGEFDAANAYAIGDVVVYEGDLYKFKVAHTADDPWDDTEVDATTVATLIAQAEPDSLTSAQVNSLLALI